MSMRQSCIPDILTSSSNRLLGTLASRTKDLSSPPRHALSYPCLMGRGQQLPAPKVGIETRIVGRGPRFALGSVDPVLVIRFIVSYSRRENRVRRGGRWQSSPMGADQVEVGAVNLSIAGRVALEEAPRLDRTSPAGNPT